MIGGGGPIYQLILFSMELLYRNCDVLCHFHKYYSYIILVSFIGGETKVHGENHQPVSSHW